MMKMKSISCVVLSMMVVILASVSLVLIVNPVLHAADDQIKIGVLDQWDYFDIDENFVLSGLSSVGYEYVQNYNLFDVIIPEGVVEVKGYYSFDGENAKVHNCLSYQNQDNSYAINTCRQIILPNSLKRIGICAFYSIDNDDVYNTGIDIEIPDGVTQIGDYAFDMFALKSISIPASVSQVGKYIFGGAFCGENKLVDGYFLYNASDYQLQSVIVKKSHFVGK